MLQWPPERSSILFLAALVSGGIWAILTLLGQHPDGGLIGMAGTSLVGGATLMKPQRRSQASSPDPPERSGDQNDGG